MSKISVDNSPYYLGVPTYRSAFPIYTKHGRIFAHATSVDAAEDIVYSLNTANTQFEDEDADSLIADLEALQFSVEHAIDTLEKMRSPTGIAATLVHSKKSEVAA